VPPVLLPTAIGPAQATPRLVSYDGAQVPFLGGPVSHLQRLGTRFALEVRLPPMRHNDSLAREWIAKLLRGKRDGVLWEWPQPDFTPPIGTIVTRDAAAAMAETIFIRALPVGSLLAVGSFLSLVVNGRRYLHNVFDSSFTGTATQAQVWTTPPLRVAVPVDALVELNPPMIQGYLEGDDLTWDLESARTVGLGFTIVEEE
jgi:hypothetical protein